MILRKIYVTICAISSAMILGQGARAMDGVEENKPEIQKRHLSYQEIRTASQSLSDAITNPEHGIREIKGIIAVTRGGTFPATIVAEFLHIKDYYTITAKSYGDDCKQGELVISNIPNLPEDDTGGAEGSGYVFIDDLVDSGRTLDEIRKLYPKAKFAVLYAKPKGQRSTDYFVEKVPQNQWLVFPWEPDWIEPKA